MSTKVCDHRCVGMLVWKNGKLLLIERKRFPFGFAPPAGHLDQDNSFEKAAKRELKEEVGLEATSLKLVLDAKKNNICRRVDGNWHHWKIYEVKATGNIKRSPVETKQIGWYSPDEIKTLAKITAGYLKGKITEEKWQQEPGIETVWYDWFKKLKII